MPNQQINNYATILGIIIVVIVILLFALVQVQANIQITMITNFHIRH